MVVPVLLRLGLGQQLGHKVLLLLHRSQDLPARKRRPVGGHNRGLRVLFADQRHGGRHLFLAGSPGAAQDNGVGMADLVVVKLAEVFHIQLDLVHIRHGGKTVQLYLPLLCHGGHRPGHVAQLAHARGLNQNAVRRILVDHLFQRLPEVAH